MPTKGQIPVLRCQWLWPFSYHCLIPSDSRSSPWFITTHSFYAGENVSETFAAIFPVNHVKLEAKCFSDSGLGQSGPIAVDCYPELIAWVGFFGFCFVSHKTMLSLKLGFAKEVPSKLFQLPSAIKESGLMDLTIKVTISHG